MGINEKHYRAIADKMYDRYLAVMAGEAEGDESDFGVSTEDFFLCHPWLDETARFEVDPIEYYGAEAFNQWIALADKFAEAQ